MASKLYRILLEAEEDDYEDNPEGEDNSDSTDYTEEVEEISEDDEPIEDKNEESEDDNIDSDEETTDYSDDDESEVDDENMGDEESEDELSPDETKQRLMLVKDYMNLYEFINDMIEKLNSNTNINLIIQQVINRVNENLRQLREQLYDYITCDFKKDSYINTLTIYNYFIKAIKVNSEMIIKISQYDSKNEQKSKGKPMKSKVTTKIKNRQ